MLPPDNFQEDPAPVIATRTSPTNLGLYLLSVVSARDFGWLGLHETTQRLEATLHSMDRLERFRGHFLNWYDTRSLAPLPPAYVSSVDSGNLAAHLLALAHACDDLMADPILSPRWRNGVTDPLDLMAEAMAAAGSHVTAAPDRNVAAAIDIVRQNLLESREPVSLVIGQMEAVGKAVDGLMAAAPPGGR